MALDLERTKRHGVNTTVPALRPTRTFDDQQISALVASNSRNVWVAADRIARASLRKGIKTDRLKLWLEDGSTVKFLWLGVDQADEPLRETLVSWGVRGMQAQLGAPRARRACGSCPQSVA